MAFAGVERIKGTLIIGLLLSPPVLLALITADHLIGRAAERAAQDRLQRRERALDRWIAGAALQPFLGRRLPLLGRRLQQLGPGSRRANDLIASVSAAWGVPIHLYFFRDRELFATSPGARDPALIARLFPGFFMSGVALQDRQREVFRPLLDRFDCHFRLETLVRMGPGTYRLGRGFRAKILFWGETRDGFGMVAWLPRPPDWRRRAWVAGADFRPARARPVSRPIPTVREYGQIGQPEFRLRQGAGQPSLPVDIRSLGAIVPGLFEPSEGRWLCPVADPSLDPPKSFPRPMAVASAAEIVWQIARSTGHRDITWADREWLFAEGLDGVIWFVAVTPQVKHTLALSEGWSGWLGLLGLVLALRAARAVWRWYRSGGRVADGQLAAGITADGASESSGIGPAVAGGSVRWRLLGMFALAAGVPLLVAYGLGRQAIRDREEVLAAEAARAGIGRIRATEADFREEHEAFLRLARRLRHWRFVKHLDPGRVASAVRSLQNACRLQRFEVRDQLGNVLFTTDDPLVHGTHFATDAFSRMAIRRHAPGRLGSAANRVSAEDVVFEGIGQSDVFGISGVLSQPDRATAMAVADYPSLYYWDVYPELATGPAFVGIIHQTDFMWPHFIRRRIPRGGGLPLGRRERREAEPVAQLLAIHCGEEHTTGEIRPDVGRRERDALWAAAFRTYQTGRIVCREVELDRGRCWATMRTDGVNRTWVFIDLVPMAPQLAALTALQWRMLAWAGMALLVAGFGGIQLAGLFLVPVGDLGDGILAIRRRDQSWRIPVRRPDEFGVLAAAFNRVLGDLRELQYARVVQESLLPAELPPIEGYDLAISSRTATDLGGDYHDAVGLPDGRVALMLGDVTGHGISAALAMSMSRATVAYACRSGWRIPGDLLERLNALFFRELRPRQKFMTFACFALDPRSHQIEYQNAGQCYPFRFTAASATVSDISLPSAPLGATTRGRRMTTTLTLAPGDALLLFTDGIAEATDRNEEPVGYERLGQWFATCCVTERASAGIVAELGAMLDRFRAPGSLPDDVTLLCLRRRDGG